MNIYVKQDLSSKEHTPFQQQMLKDCRALVDMSRKSMSNYYPGWDANHDIFQGKRQVDKQDKDARERKEPEKMVVPVGYSQAMTFIAFCFSLFTQRERMFELLGMSEADHKPAKIGEAFIARDLAYNKFDLLLYQFLLDLSKFSIGIFKVYWTRKTQRVKEQVESPAFSFLGFSLGTTITEQEVEKVKYLGNEIRCVSPYRFFPDTRLPITRFQDGEFVASEDEYTYVALKQLEKEGVVSGIDHIRNMTKGDVDTRPGARFSANITVSERQQAITIGSEGSGQTKGVVIVTEIQRTLIPKNYEVNGKPIGEEDYPVKYLIWYANDNRVIRCEPLEYTHNEYTYTVAQFNPDQHELINISLMDSIDMLQSLISWFINSRVTSVRKVISNYLIVDPEGIEMKDLERRNPVIRLKPFAGARGGIDRFIKQLDVNDVTTNHLTDVKFLQELVQMVTGISENLMGQFHGGRRSAAEARNVSAGAAARLKMLATLAYCSALEPLARQMISNLREGLDEETMVRVIGPNKALEDQGNFVKASKSDLVGDYDFELFDGTLPSEKNYTAQVLKEILVPLIGNPEAALIVQLDPRAIALEMLELQGVRNPERFTLKSPQQPAQVPGQPQLDVLPPPQQGQPPPTTNEPAISDLIAQ